MFTPSTHQDLASSTRIGSVGNSTWTPTKSATARNAMRRCLKPWTNGSTRNSSDQRVESLPCNVRAGFAAVDRGEYTDYELSNIKEIAERVKATGRKRLIALSKQ